MWSKLPVDGSERRARRRTSAAFTEFDLVVLKVDRPELGLRAGDVGTVISIVGSRYHVEFATPGGACPGILSETASALRPVAPDELFSVRRVDPPIAPRA